MNADRVFTILGPTEPQSPVVLSVPHAGRDYPAALIDRARVPVERLRALEDRHADALVGQAVAEGATAIVAHVARAAIDLNRDPREIDRGMIAGEMPGVDLAPTAKVRAGLGLFPRRLPACGELWRRPLPAADAVDWIAGAHAPYHRAIADRIAATRAIFGMAILIDCHSMPPLPVRQPGGPARIVIGDRFGASSAAALVDVTMAAVEGAGLSVARNIPYAGGYTIELHGRPRRQVNALQIEFDRSLYLDAQLSEPGAGLAACRELLADIARQLRALFLADMPIAAE